MLAEGSFLSLCVPFFPHLSHSHHTGLPPHPFSSPLCSISTCFPAHPSFPSPAHPLLSNPPHLPDLSVSSTLSFMSLSSPEVALPIMIKWTMTAWTSVEEWTLLRGFILLSAEIQREQQNNKQTWPRAGPVWILKVVKYGPNICCSQNCKIFWRTL